jgi:hypothetical protein
MKNNPKQNDSNSEVNADMIRITKQILNQNQEKSEKSET